MKYRQNDRGSDSAFTLLELLISLTITSVTIVLIFASLRIGAKAWEKGERDINNNQQHRIVFDLIKNQISSAYVYKNPAETDTNGPLFSGDGKSFLFKSTVSLNPENVSGNVSVSYQVVGEPGRKERLIIREKKEALVNNTKKKDETISDMVVELIPEAYSISFEYLSAIREKGIPDWNDQWNKEGDSGPPAAVRMTLLDDVKSDEITMIARIESKERFTKQ